MQKQEFLRQNDSRKDFAARQKVALDSAQDFFAYRNGKLCQFLRIKCKFVRQKHSFAKALQHGKRFTSDSICYVTIAKSVCMFIVANN